MEKNREEYFERHITAENEREAIKQLKEQGKFWTIKPTEIKVLDEIPVSLMRYRIGFKLKRK